MTLAGELRGECNGRPITMTGDGNCLTVRVESWRDAFALRRAASAGVQRLSPLLRDSGARLQVRIRDGRARELLPRPGWVLGLIVPGLQRSARTTAER